MRLKVRKVVSGCGIVPPKSWLGILAAGEGSLLKAEIRDGGVPSPSGLVKAGAAMLAVLVAVTCYAAIHPKVAASTAAE